jgi:hypothetical protein
MALVAKELRNYLVTRHLCIRPSTLLNQKLLKFFVITRRMIGIQTMSICMLLPRVRGACVKLGYYDFQI